MLNYYVVCVSANFDEWTEYEGLDFNEALRAYDRATAYTCHDVEIRAYELPDDTDINDRDELINTICECVGYNTKALRSYDRATAYTRHDVIK